MDCSKQTNKKWWHKQPLICSQICNAGRSWQKKLLSTALGISWGSLKAVGYNYLMAYSLPYLVIDAGSCLRSQLGLLNETPLWGLFMLPYLIYKMVAELQGQLPQERESIRRKLLWPSLWNPQHYSYCILFVEAVTSPTPGERKRLHLLMGSGKFLEDHVGLEILVWSFLKNTFYCSSYFI